MLKYLDQSEFERVRIIGLLKTDFLFRQIGNHRNPTTVQMLSNVV